MRGEFLEGQYEVLKAETLEEARRPLDEAHVHLAILDLRMMDVDDEKDVSGLALAKEPAYRAIPKIILTDYPTYTAVREALGRDSIPFRCHLTPGEGERQQANLHA